MKNYGNKADYLIKLKDMGFNVPAFDIVTLNSLLGQDLPSNIISSAGITDVNKASRCLAERIDKAEIYLNDVIIDEHKSYAVRSSSAIEDGKSTSMAGQFKTYLNIRGKENIKQKIRDCLKHQLQADFLQRVIDEENALKIGNIANVIIQEMIDSSISGIAFGVNPVSGADKEIIIECGTGIGDLIVGGMTKLDSYSYNWYTEEAVLPKQALINIEDVKRIAKIVIDIQTEFGFPVDLEFSIKEGKIYVLQARPITRVACGNLNEHFTTANFRDGGVASSACKALMYSLYEMTYDDAMRSFFIKTKSFKQSELTPQIIMHCCRPYWNVTACKKASMKVPGFVERDYDEELGISPRYEGRGLKSRITPSFIIGLPRIAFACSRVFNNNLKTFQQTLCNLDKTYNYYKTLYLSDMDTLELGKLFEQFITKDYYKSECTYFTQVFINIVRLSLFRRKFLKRGSKQDYLAALSGINNISHTRMFDALERTAYKIWLDQENRIKWQKLTAAEIAISFEKKEIGFGFEHIDGFLSKFGYHSDREVDISYPNFHEEPHKIISRVKVILENFENAVTEETTHYTASACKQKKGRLDKEAALMRKLLWQREELKDMSTRYYDIVRRFVLVLGKRLYKDGVINCVEEIFQAGYKDIINYLLGSISADKLRNIISKNILYYRSFVNYKPYGDIGIPPESKSIERSKGGKTIFGVGCGGNRVIGNARVINNAEDIDKIRAGEILVAKFFDVGWLSHFKLLSGAVTETGGMLCHSSIVAREYGLPAIVSAHGATDLIKTGDTIEIDGFSGKVTIL